MFYCKSPVLPKQLTWNCLSEPELMAWSIRARSYNIKIANILFLACMLINSAASIWSHNISGGFYFSVPFFLVMTVGIMSMTHQTKNFAYRFTASGYEVCEWKDYPKSVLVATYVFTAILVVVMLFVLITMPGSISVVFSGAGGMTLMALSRLWSKDYQKMHTEFNIWGQQWCDIKKIMLNNRRDLVALGFDWDNPNTGDFTPWESHVFCHSRDQQALIDFLRKQMPDIPCVRTKLELI